MVWGTLLLVVAHAGAWLLAIALAARFRTGSRGGDVVGAFILHALIVTVIVLIAGSAKSIGQGALTMGGVVAGASGLALGGAKVARRAWEAGLSLARELWAESAPASALCLLALTAIAVRHALNAWFFVPYSADELEYHLPKLAHWIQSGDLYRPDTLDTRSFFPSGQQLLQAWWVGILRHDAFIEGASLEAAALAMISTALLSRRLGASRVGSCLAGVLFGSMPVVLLHATCALNDLTAAALLIASFALLSRPPHVVHAGVLACVAVAMGAGVKPTVLFAAPVIALLGWMAWRRRLPTQDRQSGWGLMAILSLSAFAGSYWYLVNTLEHGNPFYPVPVGTVSSSRISLGESTVVGGPTPIRMIKSVGSLWGSRIWKLNKIDNPMIPYQAGWGIAIVALGIPALAWMLVRGGGPWRLASSGFFATLLLVFLLVEFDRWNARFVMYFPALMAAAIGAVASHRKLTAWVAILALAGSAENLRQSAVPCVFAGGGDAIMTNLPLARRDSWSLALPSPLGAERGFFESSEPALFISYNFPLYALARGDFSRPVHSAVIADPAKIAERMTRLNCRWLVVLNVPDKFQQGAEALVRAGFVRPVTKGIYERVSTP